MTSGVDSRPLAVAGIRERLAGSGSADRRSTTEQAVRGVVGDVLGKAAALGDLIDEERIDLQRLGDAVEAAYGNQRDEIESALASGTLIRSEVLSRWQDFIGTGELVRALAEGANRLRGWFTRVVGGSARNSERVGHEAEHELVALIERRADLAATAVSSAWELHPGAAAYVRNADMWRRAPETGERAAEAVEDWIVGLARLIEENGEGRKRWAQIASVGVNVVAVSLMVTVFAYTSGLTGTEMGIAAGAAAAQQKLLEHLFGSAAAKQLAEQARSELLAALYGVLEADSARFIRVLTRLDPGDRVELDDVVAVTRESLRNWHV